MIEAVGIEQLRAGKGGWARPKSEDNAQSGRDRGALELVFGIGSRDPGEGNNVTP